MNALLRWGVWTRRLARRSGPVPASGSLRIVMPRATRIPLPRRRPVIDPFCALEVQMALARVEREIEELGHQDGRFARGHHLIAARMAYDQLLGEACRLAQVDGLPDHQGIRRMMAEVELRSRGWQW